MRLSSWPPLRRCPATLICSGILTVVFLAEWLLGALTIDPLPLLAMGANSADLVKAGEWQRLVTGNLLHGGFLHFAINTLTLLYLGGYLELLLGAPRYISLLLISCLGGSLASVFLTGGLVAVGVSTGLLGLVGAMVVFSLRFAETRRAALRLLAYFVLLTVVSLLFEALLARLLAVHIDHFGHLGGLLSGMLYVVLAVRENSLPSVNRTRSSPSSLALATGLVLLFAVSAGHTTYSYVAHGMTPAALSFLAKVKMPEDAEAAMGIKFFYNNAAWILANDADASRAQLERARTAMGWVHEDDPLQTLGERDTLATLHYRLGETGLAVQLERQVLELSQSPEVVENPELMRLYQFQDDDIAFFASQLARFEWVHHQAVGPILDVGVEPPEVFLVRRSAAGCQDLDSERSDDPAESGSQIRRGLVVAKGPWGQASEIHVTLVREDQPMAFLQAFAGPEAPAWLANEKLEREFLGCDVQPFVTLLSSSSSHSPPGSEVEWRFWAMSPEAAAMP